MGGFKGAHRATLQMKHIKWLRDACPWIVRQAGIFLARLVKHDRRAIATGNDTLQQAAYIPRWSRQFAQQAKQNVVRRNGAHIEHTLNHYELSARRSTLRTPRVNAQIKSARHPIAAMVPATGQAERPR